MDGETGKGAEVEAGPLSVEEDKINDPPLGEGESRGEGEVEGEERVAEEEVVSDGEGEGGVADEEKGPSDVIKVRVLAYHKTEEDVFYNIEVVINDGKPLLLHRPYEEIRWMYRLLATNVDIGGNILPPLPVAPTPVPAHLELMGVPQSSMFGDLSRLPCLEVESFLQFLADHPFFSLNHDVHTFLTSPQLPSHTRLPSPSLWASLTSTYSNYQLSSLQDTDDDFVELLRGLNERAPVLETCSRHFSQLVAAWQRLACAELNVSEMVKEEGEWEVGRNNNCALSLSSLSNILSELQKYNHSTSTDALNTIGFTFDLQHRYNKQAKEMLYRRLGKVQTLVDVSKQLDKAKPEKKEEMERVRTEAMGSYTAINFTAKREMEEWYGRRSVLALRQNLVDLSESQLTHSRCLLAQLSSLHSQLSIIT